MKQAKLNETDKALYTVMADMILKPGEMLLLGPKSVEILTTEGMFKGSLPDKYVFQKQEWKTPVPEPKIKKTKKPKV